MNDPVLVVMAAGMGSRYGGLKQLEALGPKGEILMDYSVYDAVRAGFSEVVFVIRRDFEEEFVQRIGRRWQDRVRCHYAYQELEALPSGFVLPQGRTRPWGTGQAVLAARDYISGPFAVINADDFYGPESYRAMHRFLTGEKRQEKPALGLCVWQLGDTLSDHGTVSRGVCRLDGDQGLSDIREIRKIEKTSDGARFWEEEAKAYTELAAATPVSMNFWGLPASYLDMLDLAFTEFLEEEAPKDPLDAEYLLPMTIGRHLAEGHVTVHTMPAGRMWYGVTYRQDKPRVQEALAKLTQEGIYPCPL